MVRTRSASTGISVQNDNASTNSHVEEMDTAVEERSTTDESNYEDAYSEEESFDDDEDNIVVNNNNNNDNDNNNDNKNPPIAIASYDEYQPRKRYDEIYLYTDIIELDDDDDDVHDDLNNNKERYKRN